MARQTRPRRTTPIQRETQTPDQTAPTMWVLKRPLRAPQATPSPTGNIALGASLLIPQGATVIARWLPRVGLYLVRYENSIVAVKPDTLLVALGLVV